MNDLSWFSKLVWIASPFYRWENQGSQQVSRQARKETQTVPPELRLNPFNILLILNNNRWPFLKARDHVMCSVLSEYCLLSSLQSLWDTKYCPGLTVEEMRFGEWSLLSEERLRASSCQRQCSSSRYLYRITPLSWNGQCLLGEASGEPASDLLNLVPALLFAPFALFSCLQQRKPKNDAMKNSLFKKFIYFKNYSYWSRVALQGCVGFCCTTSMYTYFRSFLNFLSI